MKPTIPISKHREQWEPLAGKVWAQSKAPLTGHSDREPHQPAALLIWVCTICFVGGTHSYALVWIACALYWTWQMARLKASHGQFSLHSTSSFHVLWENHWRPKITLKEMRLQKWHCTSQPEVRGRQRLSLLCLHSSATNSNEWLSWAQHSVSTAWGPCWSGFPNRFTLFLQS